MWRCEITPNDKVSESRGTTLTRTIAPGPILRRGTERPYRGLTIGAGEPCIARTDLLAGSAPVAHPRTLLSFAYITDLHAQDHQSPARFEFMDRYYGSAPLHLLVPAYRPQEFLQPHAVEAMVRTINAVTAGQSTSAPVQVVMCTGDLTDNAQRNELAWAIALLSGTTVDTNNGGRRYQGVMDAGWSDDRYWHPDDVDDEYKRRWGFPSYPDLLTAALQPFQAEGIRRPWLACMGNHDALLQGTALLTPAVQSLAQGDRKVYALPERFDLMANLEHYIVAPETFLAGPSHLVTADPRRANFDRAGFVRAIAGASGMPAGHGFGAKNIASGTTYFVDDTYDDVRLIFLDTVNAGGNFHGSLGAVQFAWLEERLTEAHAHYIDVDGHRASTISPDRLVILLSHHGLDTLVNDMVTPSAESDVPRVLGQAIEALLHRFPNVVLWVNGHTHRNSVTPRPDPSSVTGGFWEVTTSSLLDWPCQSRLVELVDNGDGTLSVLCTMLDHAAPADSREAEGLWRLAAIHRELAANDPHDGIAAGNQGAALDRNVELLLRAPFTLT